MNQALTLKIENRVEGAFQLILNGCFWGYILLLASSPVILIANFDKFVRNAVTPPFTFDDFMGMLFLPLSIVSVFYLIPKRFRERTQKSELREKYHTVPELFEQEIGYNIGMIILTLFGGFLSYHILLAIFYPLQFSSLAQFWAVTSIVVPLSQAVYFYWKRIMQIQGMAENLILFVPYIKEYQHYPVGVFRDTPKNDKEKWEKKARLAELQKLADAYHKDFTTAHHKFIEDVRFAEARRYARLLGQLEDAQKMIAIRLAEQDGFNIWLGEEHEQPWEFEQLGGQAVISYHLLEAKKVRFILPEGVYAVEVIDRDGEGSMERMSKTAPFEIIFPAPIRNGSIRVMRDDITEIITLS